MVNQLLRPFVVRGNVHFHEWYLWQSFDRGEGPTPGITTFPLPFRFGLHTPWAVMISLWSPPASLANHQVKRMASYLPRIFIIHDIYVSFAAEECVQYTVHCTSTAVRSSPCQSIFWGCESLRDSVGAGVQPGEKLNLWLLLAHHLLLHKISVLYSIVWFQVGVQLPSFKEE